MTRTLMASLGAALLIAGAGAAAAQTSIAEDVLQGCETELQTHCEGVTPGEGRLLACLYAYGDKLSGQCEYALYDAAVRLERAVNALTYVASECDADIEQFCGSVEMGEGRIAQCLNDHASELSSSCNTALTDVGLLGQE
jgi:hypothetical protein